eukprot:355767-Chlamydomonas_euryale.AAC.6
MLACRICRISNHLNKCGICSHALVHSACVNAGRVSTCLTEGYAPSHAFSTHTMLQRAIAPSRSEPWPRVAASHSPRLQQATASSCSERCSKPRGPAPRTLAESFPKAWVQASWSTEQQFCTWGCNTPGWANFLAATDAARGSRSGGSDPGGEALTRRDAPLRGAARPAWRVRQPVSTRLWGTMVLVEAARGCPTLSGLTCDGLAEKKK